MSGNENFQYDPDTSTNKSAWGEKLQIKIYFYKKRLLPHESNLPHVVYSRGLCRFRAEWVDFFTNIVQISPSQLCERMVCAFTQVSLAEGVVEGIACLAIVLGRGNRGEKKRSLESHPLRHTFSISCK